MQTIVINYKFVTSDLNKTYILHNNIIIFCFILDDLLVTFLMLSSTLSQPLIRVVGIWQAFQQADIAVKRLWDVMNAPAEPMTLIPTRVNVNQATNITVDSLGFRYGDDLPWLYQNLNFNIQAGHCVLIMGSSGCGKSTLAKILLAFNRGLSPIVIGHNAN